ncbi:MAG: xanthine dehydrogenase family protein molybdopterin-binding subunit [Chloroflexi bacterium]|nr:xanthine dehydrogenase family protein molybdopterin-binding subunit [Chloroflexota bacterium]MDA1270236.1 xanthine dehydrogenase family protein molybdopterin-binding subunit [Chloroflexota bacterium]PKB59611.1 MAG: oxidoreductase [SAR202 cluster bacterium Casp-Chloro-G2]
MTVKTIANANGFRVIGATPLRHDAMDKVTGQARYGADISLPGLLHGKILRSPHAHAKIRSIDASKALALPGVKAVVTSADLPVLSGRPVDVAEGSPLNPRFLSNNVLAADKALYRGHAIAGVAADSVHTAEQALALIDVDYEVLTPVLDGKEAMKPGAPILHDMLFHSEGEFFRPGGLRDEGDDSPPTNIASHFVFGFGDLEQGFKDADVIVEREFRTKPVHQGYIEPHSATARWDRDGRVTIWGSSQGHFAIRDFTALVLGERISNVKVIPMEIGGGFGGKLVVYVEPVAALLSKKSGRPVKITMTRPEVFEATGATAGGYIRAKIGATDDGRITAADAHFVYESGAFPGALVNLAAYTIFAPYDIANIRSEGYDVVVNKPKVAPYRAPLGPPAGFAGETLIDELAEKLSMDPIEFRLINAAKEGTRRVTGVPFKKIGYVETLQAAQMHPHYNAPLGGPNRGRGLATAVSNNITGPANAVVTLQQDGSVGLVEGSADLAGSRTAAAMHVAEVLGIPPEDVHPSVGDTDSIGYTAISAGSSAVYKTGWASFEAARDMQRQLAARAALIWDVPVEEVEIADGVYSHRSDPELRLTLKELAARQNTTGGPILGRAGGVWGGESPGFAVHIVDVEVDPETGKTGILRYTAIQDPGRAVHPTYVAGQIQGGAVQGIGWALNEEYVTNSEGRMLNSSWLDYRMPVAKDLPMIDTQIVEVPNPEHPTGVRGVGEVSIIPPIPAIANAIYRAIGIRMNETPMSPGAVLEAIWERDSSSS